METFVVRLWLPDRPGALGAVASRIGAVRGDVVGIDILERGAGRVIDELVVELPDAHLVSTLVAEIGEVDGVDVEDVRPSTEHVLDARLDALETAEVLVSAMSVDAVCESLVAHAALDFQAHWCVLAGVDAAEPSVSVGVPPAAAWLHAFVAGSRYSVETPPGDDTRDAGPSGPVSPEPGPSGPVSGEQGPSGPVSGEQGPDDVAWAPLPTAGRALVLGRKGRPLRTRERRQLAALARIADHRLRQIETELYATQPRDRSTARRQSA
jgi:hypothetical protein